ncbi:UbiA-domain-containing protein [Pluteus cervinus]|uniref:UbiA-domain-containing protein n=1 Tax=Pluteus cervinus TaxID=181527 RepID=A0ACD3BCG8_9AGAR|nr:UbiA-domain-containing protein [Pluteus cervinus]
MHHLSRPNGPLELELFHLPREPSMKLTSSSPRDDDTSKPTPSIWKRAVDLAPTPVQPYLELIRFDKPTGTMLTFWPSAWGLTLAAYRIDLPIDAYAWNLFRCLISAFILRSSACTVNDIFDREMDAGVERTKNRPLASGRISVPSATIFLLAQYLIGVCFFCFTLDGIALCSALFQLFPLFGIYPLLKRVTYWPQAWLGFAMNFSLITHWTAQVKALDVPLLAVALAGCWCWTMLYDTIYACQDLEDDVKVGVRSTAILFGSSIRTWLNCCAIIFVLAFGVVGYMNHQALPFLFVSVIGSAIHLSWQIYTVDLKSPASCWRNFRRNGHLGWIIWAGLVVDFAAKPMLRHDK